MKRNIYHIDIIRIITMYPAAIHSPDFHKSRSAAKFSV
jgi:hypothetical protein